MTTLRESVPQAAPPVTQSLAPVFERYGDGYRCRLYQPDIEIEVENLAEGRDGMVADVLIAELIGGSRKMLSASRWNLMAPQTRRTMVDLLTRRLDVDWHQILENVCFLVREHQRAGDETVDVWDVDTSERERWICEPFVPANGIGIIYAMGGAGKSALAAGIAITVASGVGVVGSPTYRSANVLYVDWEATAGDFAERVKAISAAHGIASDDCPIAYRRLYASLAESVGVIKREILKRKIGFVILDSLGAAAGGEPESADLAIRMMMSARQLGVPVLGIDHVTKAASDSTMSRQPFGSVYKHNLARVTWSVEKAQTEDENTITVLMRNQKQNNGRLYRPRSFELSFTMGGMDQARLEKLAFRRVDALDNPELSKKMSLSDRILHDLKHGARLAEDIAEALEVDKHQVRTRLGELERSGRVVHLDDRRYGLR